jgi:hypothetical protein
MASKNQYVIYDGGSHEYLMKYTSPKKFKFKFLDTDMFDDDIPLLFQNKKDAEKVAEALFNANQDDFLSEPYVFAVRPKNYYVLV